MRSYLLFDFSNLAYASFFRAISEAKIASDQIPIGYKDHVKYFVDRVQQIHQYHGLAKIVYALDRKPEYKYKIYPNYKKGRNKLTCTDGSFYDAKQPCLDEVEALGSTVIYADKYEADDVIASFVAQNFDNEITVVSSDKDLWAILDHPNARILNFLKNEYVTKQHLREAFCIKDKYGVIQNNLTEFSQVKLWKQLWGDSSDNIPNVVSRMKKQLLPFVVASDGTWEDFESRLDYTKLTPRCQSLLKDNVDKLKINAELVSLKYNLKIETKLYQPRKQPSPVVDPKDFEILI